MRERFIHFIKKYDFSFLIIMTAIFIMGILNLYSATYTHENQRLQNLYVSQIIWFLFSLVIAFFTSLISPKSVFRSSYFFYVINILLLGLVLMLGREEMGAQRWLIIGPLRLQPSEIMKVALVMTLARWFSAHSPERELRLRRLFIPALLTLIPCLLIFMQPDLGTGVLLVLIFLFMSFYHRLTWRSIAILLVLSTVGGSAMYHFALKDYQKKRILTFLDPKKDARGSGYNAIQSEIAIGSGRLFGKGYMKSSQASLNFLPENHTDFVFSIFNEEHGFFGSLFLIALYLILFLRFVWLAGVVLRFYDSLLVIGLMSIFFWHTFINMCMVMGLMPIVGLPLPMMSYGGSSLVTFSLCIGLATSMSNSRNLF